MKEKSDITENIEAEEKPETVKDFCNSVVYYDLRNR